LFVPEIERQMGIEAYATHAAGVGGVIRKRLEDFVVEEVLVDGSKATVEKAQANTPLGATQARQRFLFCVLVKRNWDTFIAVKNVAKELLINQARIQIAGIKDAKAVTAQHVTIDGVSAEEALKVNVRDVELRPLGYFHESLSTFYLLGNHFSIKVAELNQSAAEIEQRITEAKREIDTQGGIPNFYGHQRFGSTRAITHLVGKALIGGNLEEAVFVFLAQASPNEHADSRQKRQSLMKNRDFKQALADFPAQLRYERLMLSYLVEHPDDFASAFRQLPPKLCQLFVQAYQSYLFNRFLSERIKAGFPINEAVAGDYVVNVERSGLPMTRTGKNVVPKEVQKTNEQIAAGKLRVALPVVGFKQKLSQGAVGEVQQKILEEENVALSSFRVECFPDVGARGELRAAASPVKDFTLAVSEDAEGTQACLEFTLLRGSYATVLLREIMKPKDPIVAGF
jgi:tRNA pseudouridine13 synthase